MVTTFAPALETLPATPALVIDLPVVHKNLARLREYAWQHSITVRPHTKTHKSSWMSRLQMEYGACGLTCAKVGEAEALVDTTDDILLAYPAIDFARTSRLALLAATKMIRVAVDSQEGIQRLANAARQAGTNIGILVDLDIGFHRTGVASALAALKLAQVAESLSPHVRLDGIFFYPGHVWTPASEQQSELQLIEIQLAETVSLWEANGFAAKLISGGSTPTLYQSHLIPSQTEVRPGTYLYNDMNTQRAGFCGWDELAAAVVCTVVSTAVPEKAVVDGGTKTFTSDRNVRFPDSGHGFVLEYPDAKLVRLSEEHGELDLTACRQRPALGERISIIPNHICPCVNLQDTVFLQHENHTLVKTRVDARGCLS